MPGDHNLLDLLRTRTVFPQRSFACAAPCVWNSLPCCITGDLNIAVSDFKSVVKTFLYTHFYFTSSVIFC